MINNYAPAFEYKITLKTTPCCGWEILSSAKSRLVKQIVTNWRHMTAFICANSSHNQCWLIITETSIVISQKILKIRIKMYLDINT